MIESERSDARPAPAGQAAPAGDRLLAFFREHDWALDAVLIVAVTLAAAITRLVLLGEIPYGLHPDEAQVGTDVHKILRGDFIHIYTTAVLGQPSGHAWISLPAIWLLGDTLFAVRLTLALVAIAAIPLLYALVRVTCGRVEASFAAAMLTVSYWHLMYSRVAHWSISYGTVLLAVLLCLALGMKTRNLWWFAGAGLAMGLGIYTYNIYPIAVVAVAVFLAIITWLNYREDLAWWSRAMLITWGIALIIATPMIVYISNPDSFYWFHINNYQDVGVLDSPEFKEAGFGGKVQLIAEQAKTFVAHYGWDANPDIVDGFGIRPVFDPPTLVLLAGGLILAFFDRRNAMVIAALCCLLIIPLPAVLQRGSIMRQPVAAAPFVAFLAALPLAWLWRGALRAWDVNRIAAVASIAGAVAALALVTTITVRDYFWVWREDDWTRLIYSSEITTASTYMDRLPDDAYVLLYSDRWPFSIEIRQFLAPDAHGEDRSFEFGGNADDVSIPDPARPTAFILVGNYVGRLEQVEEAHPAGTRRVFQRDGKLEFVAYEVGFEGTDGH